MRFKSIMQIMAIIMGLICITTSVVLFCNLHNIRKSKETADTSAIRLTALVIITNVCTWFFILVGKMY